MKESRQSLTKADQDSINNGGKSARGGCKKDRTRSVDETRLKVNLQMHEQQLMKQQQDLEVLEEQSNEENSPMIK